MRATNAILVLVVLLTAGWADVPEVHAQPKPADTKAGTLPGVVS